MANLLKIILLITGVVFQSSFVYAEQTLDSLDLIKKAAAQACSSNPDKRGCERMVWMTAKVSMMNTHFYMESCANPKAIARNNVQACENAARLLNQLTTIK